ncbi:SDR family NAD(P)-dependent oxidoreductase [Burkholderia ambifaria]|uniref:SDR family NAD(P)-dependent oxidoreductase n=1 Tax=Burkholderia ambifaria TaxID=152480 RepID=UPI0031FE3ABF
MLKVRTDIAERVQCRHLATQAIERFGRIDALVNSAFVHGTFPEAVEDADLDGWRAVFDTNVFGTMTLTQEIVPHMKRQRRDPDDQHAGDAQAICRGIGLRCIEGRARVGVHGTRANSIHMGGCGACRRRRISGRRQPSTG